MANQDSQLYLRSARQEAPTYRQNVEGKHGVSVCVIQWFRYADDTWSLRFLCLPRCRHSPDSAGSEGDHSNSFHQKLREWLVRGVKPFQLRESAKPTKEDQRAAFELFVRQNNLSSCDANFKLFKQGASTDNFAGASQIERAQYAHEAAQGRQKFLIHDATPSELKAEAAYQSKTPIRNHKRNATSLCKRKHNAGTSSCSVNSSITRRYHRRTPMGK
jgi:hypothetical protein